MIDRQLLGYGIEKLGWTWVMCIVKRYNGMYAGLLCVRKANSGIVAI